MLEISGARWVGRSDRRDALGSIGSMRASWIGSMRLTRTDRIDRIQVDRPGRWDYLESIGSMIATQIRVGGSSWRAAIRQVDPPSFIPIQNARLGGLADRNSF